jgi:lipid-A-disaccharide synthase
MRAEGAQLIEDARRMAVMGVVEVLRKIPHHYQLLRSLDARLASGKIGLVILIDYPGFNMKVAARAKTYGVPVLYYVTPQVWAWGAGRLPKLAQLITKAAPILEFEEALLRSHGIDATFVGHPLLDRAGALPSREAARAQLNVSGEQPVLALFPGSREQELHRHLDDFVATAQRVQERRPDVRVVVSVAATVDVNAARCPFPLVRDASFTVLRAADAALCKSGTTTLEAAVAGCPLVVVYRTSAITYALARRWVKIPHIALVNVVAGREVAPELVQDAFVPTRAAGLLDQLLDHRSGERRAQVEGLADVRSKLGTAGAAERVAAMALQLW